MKSTARSEQIRWQVLKAMLDEFPSLKVKTRKYLEESEPREDFKAVS